MNETVKEELIRQRNIYYYNQMIVNEKNSLLSKNVLQKTKKKSKSSFGSQKIDLRDFIFAPKKWEGVFYTFYAIFIPYGVGAVFLFFFIAGGNYENFKLLNMNAFLIIWLIGYEVVATFSLLWIMVLYLQYEENITS